MRSRGQGKKKNIYDKRNAFSSQQKEAVSTCCISNFKTRRVKEFRTLETSSASSIPVFMPPRI